MRIHYVEDNPKDAELLSRMVEDDKAIQLTVSAKINDFVDQRLQDVTDFVLLDIRRPDAVSIKDDIARIRKFTNAPIVFVTSDSSDGVRQEAFESGAEAVLDKNELNSNLLRQVAINSMQKHIFRPNSNQQETEANKRRRRNELEQSSLAHLKEPFAYVEMSLQTLYDAMVDSGRDTTANYVSHLLETMKAIRTYAEDDLTVSTRTAIHDLLVESAERVSRTAKARLVDLVIEAETSWFTQMGSKPLAGLGVQHLIDGLLRGLNAGDRMSVRSERDNDGIALNIFLNRPIIKSSIELFDLSKASPTLGSDAKASLQLGLMLLGVTADQVEFEQVNGHIFLKLFV